MEDFLKKFLVRSVVGISRKNHVWFSRWIVEEIAEYGYAGTLNGILDFLNLNKVLKILWRNHLKQLWKYLWKKFQRNLYRKFSVIFGRVFNLPKNVWRNIFRISWGNIWRNPWMRFLKETLKEFLKKKIPPEEFQKESLVDFNTGISLRLFEDISKESLDEFPKGICGRVSK